MQNNKKSEVPKKQKLNPLFFVAIAVALVAIAVVNFVPDGNKGSIPADEAPIATEPSTDKELPNSSAIPATVNENGDVVIKTADITETATFYEHDANGTKMGLFAVKAEDGTIRTAFDTCQVCNGSPYAYFLQRGNLFECQNCGNLYKREMIEQERGGCNPVPIMADEKTVTDTEIIIPAQLLKDNAERFENWKNF